MWTQATISGKHELYLDHACRKAEGTIFPAWADLLSFCYLRRLCIVPEGLGRCRLVPMRGAQAVPPIMFAELRVAVENAQAAGSKTLYMPLKYAERLLAEMEKS